MIQKAIWIAVLMSMFLSKAEAGIYCDAMNKFVARYNMFMRKFEETLPSENINSPKNPKYKPSFWEVVTCEETTYEYSVVGMMAVDSIHVWPFEALKAAYPFDEKSVILHPAEGYTRK